LQKEAIWNTRGKVRRILLMTLREIECFDLDRLLVIIPFVDAEKGPTVSLYQRAGISILNLQADIFLSLFTCS
jgi:hypothetical protein